MKTLIHVEIRVNLSIIALISSINYLVSSIESSQSAYSPRFF